MTSWDKTWGGTSSCAEAARDESCGKDTVASVRLSAITAAAAVAAAAAVVAAICFSTAALVVFVTEVFLDAAKGKTD